MYTLSLLFSNLTQNIFSHILLSNSYQPAASVGFHVAVNLNWLRAIIVNIDGVDTTRLKAILHHLKAVHGEGVEQAN